MKLNPMKFWPVVLLSVLPSTGCMTAVKQAYYEVKGAQGDVRPNAPVADLAAAGYQSLTIDPVKTTLAGKLCPPEVVRAMDVSLGAMKEDLGVWFPGNGKSLRLSTEIYYFQKKGVLSGGMLVVRLYAYDGERVVIDALVLGETNSFREGGEKDLTNATAYAVGEYLINHRMANADAEKAIKDYRKHRAKENDSNSK